MKYLSFLTFLVVLYAVSACLTPKQDPVPGPVITEFSPKAGTIGSTVRLTGRNFTAFLENNLVQFSSGVKAVVTSATTTELTVTVPAGAVTGPITINVANQIATTAEPFTLINFTVPDVVTGDTSGVSTTAFSIAGKLTGLGITPGPTDVTQYGHVLSTTNQTPTTADTKTEMGSTNAPKDFKSTFTSLKPGTTYYVRAYAINATGTGYGQVVTIATGNVRLPVVTSADGTDITPASFNITGRVTDIGTADVSQFGHVVSETNQTPTTADTKTEMGGTNAPKDFKSTFGSLKPSTTYYIRAYATNPVGTAYSDMRIVKTTNALPPTVTTGDISNVGPTAATVGMNLVAVGTNATIQAGVCWSNTNQNPTIVDAKTANGANSPQFFSNSLTNLSPNTTYYVRAYATSLVGTGYGEVKSFKTGNLLPPTVTSPTSGSELVGTTTLSVYGRIEDVGVGGGSIIQYGHCWSSSNQNPTINDSKTTRGNLDSQFIPYGFISNLTGLTPNTTYYVRAYATTASGTGYSTVRIIKTTPLVPPIISAVKLESPLLCSFAATNQAFYDSPCLLDNKVVNGEVRVSFTYESKTETPSKFGICLVPDGNISGDPTVNNPTVETGNSYVSLVNGSFVARFNVLDKTGNTKTVNCGACTGNPLAPPCGNQKATEYIYRNAYVLPHSIFLLGGGTKKSVAYRYRAYIVMTNGNIYYGPTTAIDVANVANGCGPQ